MIARALLLAFAALPLVAGDEFFEQKIRPVLVEQCYDCHSVEKHKGGLALDTRAGWEKGGDSGPAIVRGRPEKSLLITSLRHTDPDLKMPRKAPKLDDAVIADFVRWVEMGAPDPREQPAAKVAQRPWAEVLAERKKWWCFQPVANPAPPAVKDAAWSEHPVDRFILAKLEAAGLRPAPDAPPEVLARRRAFVLTGLPPMSGASDTDALLASPAFGEKWARHWLDLARYAETYGSEHDYLNPHAWRYRDYVIRAFNDDLPYDQFVREQIAGDLLPPRWKDGLNEAKLATAWQRMIENYATPVDVKREEVSVIDWQLEALGKTFLGLTITCARCHDHKFDPISDEDFHALYGVFASTRPTLSILDDPAKLTACDAELAEIKAQLRPLLAAQWEKDVRAAKLSANDAPSQDEPAFDFTGWRVSGPGLPAQPTRAGLLSLGSGERFVRAIQPAGFFSDTISERHGGAIRSPDFILEKRAVSVLASGSGKARLRLVIENFQNDLLLYKQVNPDLDSAAPQWVTMKMKDQWLGRRARVELLTRDDKTCVGAQKDQAAFAKTDGRSAFGIQRVVLHDGNAPKNPTPSPTKDAALAALAAWKADRATDDDTRVLQALLDAKVLASGADASPEIAALAARFREIENAIPLPTRAPGVCDDGSGYDCEFFPRGDHLTPGAPVPRRFLEALGGAPLGGTDSGRLDLARELTRPDNPLVARVMVNRVWQHLFGRGLVPTPDNFGRMGELPTHPELLDHLATKFIADGWSVKTLIRYLVATRTWQLAVSPLGVPPSGGLLGVPPSGGPAKAGTPNEPAEAGTPNADEIDPTNALLSHAHVRRLEAEAIRDAMLVAAGNYQPGNTGPGVRVFYRTQIDPDKQPPAGPVDGDGCRSIYLEARRLFPSEFLAVFDAPKPNIFNGRRSETNVPAQSLALLNDPFAQHQAKLLAQRLDGTNEQRIARLYRLAFARPPTSAETERALGFVRKAGADAWRDLAHAVFNMKEFIYLR